VHLDDPQPRLGGPRGGAGDRTGVPGHTASERILRPGHATIVPERALRRS
jgi:hypothetical protein